MLKPSPENEADNRKPFAGEAEQAEPTNARSPRDLVEKLGIRASLRYTLRQRRQALQIKVSQLDRAIALLDADPSLEYSLEILRDAERGSLF